LFIRAMMSAKIALNSVTFSSSADPRALMENHAMKARKQAKGPADTTSAPADTATNTTQARVNSAGFANSAISVSVVVVRVTSIISDITL
jgi:hypothetical protein